MHRGVAFLPYGDFWRKHRRMFQQHFHERLVPVYWQKTTLEVNLTSMAINLSDSHLESAREEPGTSLRTLNN